MTSPDPESPRTEILRLPLTTDVASGAPPTNSKSAVHAAAGPERPEHDTSTLPLTTTPHGANDLSLLQAHSRDAFTIVRPHRTPASTIAVARIGKFRIVRELGRGGMGTVYEAIQEDVQRRVALKVPGRMDREELLRFEWEARILAQLHDPHIATLYEHGLAPDEQGEMRPYFAMELVEGVTLGNFLKNTAKEPQVRVALLRQIAETVGRAHRRGIVHRDLKPGNILVDSAGTPHILDFGVARFTEGRPDALQTMAGQVVGTVFYMAPEQARGDSDRADATCDVYALGTILYEMLTDQHPLKLEGRPLLDALRAIEEESPMSLGRVDRRLRGDLEIIVEKALRKEAMARYETAAEFADDLGRWLEDAPITARRLTLGYQFRKFVQRHRYLASAAAVMGIVLIVAAAMVVQAWQSERDAHADAEAKRKDAQDARQRAEAAQADAETARRHELEEALVRLQQRGDWKAVLDTAERLDRLPDANHDQVATDRVIANFVLGRYEVAKTILDQLAARESELGNSRARVYLYRGLIAQTAEGNPDEARRHVRAALDTKQLSVGDHEFCLAFLSSTRAEAEGHLRAGVKAEPFNYLCLSYLTLFVVIGGDAQEAESLIRLGEQLFPFDPNFLEYRVTLQTRVIGKLDVEQLRDDAIRRMDAAQVDRAIASIQTNYEVSQIFDRLFDAILNGDQREVQAVQRELLASGARLFTNKKRRTSTLVAPLPAIDSGYGELISRAPLALVGIGRESLYEYCVERYRATQDPMMVFVGFMLRAWGVKEWTAFSQKQLQELTDLLDEAAARPCLLRRMPHLLRFVRLGLLTEMRIRAEAAADSASEQRLHQAILADCRLLLRTQDLSPRQRALVIVALTGLAGRPLDVRVLGDQLLIDTPDDANVRVLVALAELIMGNPGRAERLVSGLESDEAAAGVLKKMPGQVMNRVQSIRHEQMAIARHELAKLDTDIWQQLLALARQMDRLGRPADAELIVRLILAECDRKLADPSSGSAALPSPRAHLLNVRATVRWRIGDYEGACDDSVAAIAADANQADWVANAAPRLLLAGRREEYVQVMRAALERWKSSDDRVAGAMIAEAALWLQEPTLVDAAAALAERAVANSTQHPQHHYLRRVAGWAAVRRGVYEANRGAKGPPFVSELDHDGAEGYAAALALAIGAHNTPQAPFARQRLLELAPYFTQLTPPQLAYEPKLLGLLSVYREAATRYGVEREVKWREQIDWQMPSEMQVTDIKGRSLTSQADGSWRGDRSDPALVHRFEFRSSAPSTALRFEVLPDPSLPFGGPGTTPNSGRCHIAEVRVSRVLGEDVEAVPVKWAMPASNEPPQGRISLTFDGTNSTDWGPDMDAPPGQPLDGIFVLSKPVSLRDGERLRVEVFAREAFGLPLRMRLRATATETP